MENLEDILQKLANLRFKLWEKVREFNREKAEARRHPWGSAKWLEHERNADSARADGLEIQDQMDELEKKFRDTKRKLQEIWEDASDLLEKSAEELELAEHLELAIECLKNSVMMVNPSHLKPWLMELPETPEDYEKIARRREKAYWRKGNEADLHRKLGNKKEARKADREAERLRRQAKQDYQRAAREYQNAGKPKKAQDMRDEGDSL